MYSLLVKQPPSIPCLVRSSIAVVCSALLGGVLLCVSGPVLAQMGNGGTIRSKSDEVLVPVLVLDKQRVAELQHIRRSVLAAQFTDGDFHSLDRVVVRSLTAGEFRVFEDGQQQEIENVTPEGQNESPIITDNVGKYREFVDIGGGTWAIPLWENIYPGRKVAELPPLWGYEIGYKPPPSPDGTCHKVRVVVDRPNSLVFARDQYCEAARYGAADPLKGTTLEKRIESDLQNKRPSQLSLDMAAIPLLAGDGTAPVRIVVDYTSSPVIEGCKSTPATIGIIGMFLGDDGREVLRFSDEAARAGGDDFAVGQVAITLLLGHYWIGPCLFTAPFRYEKQIQIAPGNYHLQIGFMDGDNFGSAEVPVTVPSYRGDRLRISGIALARRFRDIQMEVPESPTAASARKFDEFPMQTAESSTSLPESYAPLLADGAEITPTANTRFDKNSPVCFYFQIYEPLWSEQPQAKVEAQLRIVDAKTGRLMAQIKPVDATSYAQAGNPLISIGRRIDVSALPTGSYQLRAKATDSTGASTEWRSVTFVIE